MAVLIVMADVEFRCLSTEGEQRFILFPNRECVYKPGGLLVCVPCVKNNL